MVAWASGRQRQVALARGEGEEPQMPPHPRLHQGRAWRHICIGGQRQKMFLATRRRHCVALTVFASPGGPVEVPASSPVASEWEALLQGMEQEAGWTEAESWAQNIWHSCAGQKFVHLFTHRFIHSAHTHGHLLPPPCISPSEHSSCGILSHLYR